jgi:hypothetical protein
MFSGLTSSAGSALGGGRFSLVSVLPVAVLGGYIALLVECGAYSGHPEGLDRVAQLAQKNPGWTAAAVFGIFLAALLLRPFQMLLVQALEGYWTERAPFGPLAQVAVERHQRRFELAQSRSRAWVDAPAANTLEQHAAQARAQRRADVTANRAGALLDLYPLPVESEVHFVNDQLMPTMLGNILRDGENAAGHRYGLDLNTVEHRLRQAMSPRLQGTLDRQLDLLDALCALCVMFTAAFAVSAQLIALWDAWSLAPCAAVLAAFASYRGALRIADEHRSILATAVDLHRFDMIRQLHYKLPGSAREERRLNEALSDFISVRREPATQHMRRHKYDHGDPASTPDNADSSA